MSKGYPLEGTDRLSLDTVALIRRAYPKIKTFWDRHLAGGDVALPTFYRAMDLDNVAVSTVRIIEGVGDNLRAWHKLSGAELFDAMNSAVSLISFLPRTYGDDEKSLKRRKWVQDGVAAFLDEYNKKLSDTPTEP